MIEQIHRVLASEATKEKWRDSYNSTEWNEANELNKLLFGIPLNQRPKCHCLEDFFYMLKSSKSQAKIIMESTRSFKIRKGIMIQNHALPTPLTENSSEQDIINALKILPHIAKDCELIPDNWRAVVAGREEVKNEELPVEKTEIEEPIEVEEVSEAVDYSKMKNKDLIRLLKERNIEAPAGANKAKMVELLSA